MVRNIKSRPPPSSWVKLNTKATKVGSMVGYGGLIRDEFDNWLCRFSKFMDRCHAYVEKFWGCYLVSIWLGPMF